MDLSKAKWRKSSLSSDSGDACIEVAADASVAGIRDSKDPDRGAILLNRTEARALAARIKNS
ncbi:hypothetical protein GCM10009678_69120 [Actinomadura kijaniata]|uniref:DUF397 domain-containing protein n=1 Tax=Actinomadura namibiensis TaxID=182080 RepID=A0A7W3LQI6_ACTNM|nr:DUF397 domain-containing protein [Actinomadura namibiensis]MBA8952350.1 hypothetical protein [Actinomadura namibiensis]